MGETTPGASSSPASQNSAQVPPGTRPHRALPGTSGRGPSTDSPSAPAPALPGTYCPSGGGAEGLGEDRHRDSGLLVQTHPRAGDLPWMHGGVGPVGCGPPFPSILLYRMSPPRLVSPRLLSLPPRLPLPVSRRPPLPTPPLFLPHLDTAALVAREGRTERPVQRRAGGNSGGAVRAPRF